MHSPTDGSPAQIPRDITRLSLVQLMLFEASAAHAQAPTKEEKVAASKARRHKLKGTPVAHYTAPAAKTTCPRLRPIAARDASEKAPAPAAAPIVHQASRVSPMEPPAAPAAKPAPAPKAAR